MRGVKLLVDERQIEVEHLKALLKLYFYRDKADGKDKR
jgi:hypothetical protein